MDTVGSGIHSQSPFSYTERQDFGIRLLELKSWVLCSVTVALAVITRAGEDVPSPGLLTPVFTFLPALLNTQESEGLEEKAP